MYKHIDLSDNSEPLMPHQTKVNKQKHGYRQTDQPQPSMLHNRIPTSKHTCHNTAKKYGARLNSMLMRGQNIFK